jgi:hypothetical protein
MVMEGVKLVVVKAKEAREVVKRTRASRESL